MDSKHGVSDTLTIIKSKHRNVFGRFAELSWESTDRFVPDPGAFVFSLINKDNKPFKLMYSNDGKDAIGCFGDNGPLFGSNGSFSTNIFIESDSNKNEIKNSCFGNTYKHPDYSYGTDNVKTIDKVKTNKVKTITGSHYFKTVDVEIFTKKE